MIERVGKRLQDGAAVLAPNQVPEHALLLTPGQLALEMRGETLARLVARRHPRSHHEFHAPSDDVGGHFDSTSYDPRVRTGSEDDRELLGRARAGDLDAFAEFVRVYEHRLRVVVARLLDDTRDVEEAVQDSFVQAWRHLDRYRGDAAAFTWLYRIGVNEALARRRRKTLATTDLDSPAAAAVAETRRDVQPEESAETSDARARVIAHLRELPFEYREAVVLRDIAALSNEEVAAALDISVAAAKSRIHRGRMQLRDRLEGAAPGHE